MTRAPKKNLNLFVSQINWKLFFAAVALMWISLFTIAGCEAKMGAASLGKDISLSWALFSSPKVLGQLRWQILGVLSFFALARFDYNHLREWTWILYLLAIFSLIGLFFVEPIANVHRWYRIPFLGMSIQPAEYAKLIAVMAMAWYLEQNKQSSWQVSVAFGLFCIAFPIFFLIYKQPDLGGALVFIPMVAAVMSFGQIHSGIRKSLTWLSLVLLAFVSLIFMGVLDHEQMRPVATRYVKEYQYERLNPKGYHQNACQTSISIGGTWGRGLNGAQYSRGGWLPEATTDAVFAAWTEMFGLLGASIVLGLYALLLNETLNAALYTKDSFGQLLAAGVSVYLAAHVIVNIGMVAGILPMTGVPLPLMSYGGSSVLANMAALGVVQSIYSRRFLF